MIGDIDVMMDKLYQDHMLKIENHLKEQLKNCVPPIKGEVTKGKLKHRGIVMCSQEIHASSKKEYYLMQRGVKIGKSIKL